MEACDGAVEKKCLGYEAGVKVGLMGGGALGAQRLRDEFLSRNLK